MAGHGGYISEYNQFHTGTGDGDVHATKVSFFGQKHSFYTRNWRQKLADIGKIY